MVEIRSVSLRWGNPRGFHLIDPVPLRNTALSASASAWCPESRTYPANPSSRPVLTFRSRLRIPLDCVENPRCVCGKTKQENAMTKAKTKRPGKPARDAKPKPQRKPTNAAAPNPDCPYRVGTLYASLFIEGNRDYVSKDELIKLVAEKTCKPIFPGFVSQVNVSDIYWSRINKGSGRC